MWLTYKLNRTIRTPSTTNVGGRKMKMLSLIPKCLSRACFGPAACACNPGFYRNKAGKCVTQDECEDDNMEIITLPQEAALTCSNNEVFDECGNDCESKCNEKEKKCKKGRLCFVGAGACACGDGFYRNKAGKCVTEDECEDDNMEIITLPPGKYKALHNSAPCSIIIQKLQFD
ncbi:trypsin Inhibitor like cysteine rich domain protein [Ancylostoma duodenale]|uniref:Trypsin Inhibitor like cysteine rich domain protein n=1 Tax=Ancylostoma duodenale TaxID=51022 RepID=A0A0C2DTG1_9BILA|nr:trypsin Inhibitor like cysteine rich domain protein [Ancylostoma duodenale]